MSQTEQSPIRWKSWNPAKVSLVSCHTVSVWLIFDISSQNASLTELVFVSQDLALSIWNSVYIPLNPYILESSKYEAITTAIHIQWISTNVYPIKIKIQQIEKKSWPATISDRESYLLIILHNNTPGYMFDLFFKMNAIGFNQDGFAIIRESKNLVVFQKNSGWQRYPWIRHWLPLTLPYLLK